MAWSSTLARSSSSSISPNQHLRYDSSSLCDTLKLKCHRVKGTTTCIVVTYQYTWLLPYTSQIFYLTNTVPRSSSPLLPLLPRIQPQ